VGIKILNVATMIVIGAMVADALANGQTTTSIIDSIGKMWNSSITTVAGK
jgi:hypothetical protein